ncbi:MFS transporter [Clavibacter nebraskensis]|uniref:MFS permease, transporter family 2.A.1 n=3 Tax=Clavibacter nebraskensis TaxID=31963 RepID=A0AAI9EJF7_9MICO|nr:MFS transporter [Clavibacter nebraskensis]QGV65717.1 MFS transporter [Clavibacter nebraskensis]QGV68512.1 MFS transporter [Clavibacter nebraskensis]QGV71303.1 MFS transporter [Clavibacter nebraskensis]UQB05365.1 MFS transporter [Clavibacter nebraskensis]UQB08188.1 MFS transporter [Clavibacter nebraskensis]
MIGSGANADVGRFRSRPLRALVAAQVAASTGAGLSLTIASVAVLELSGSERIAGLAQTAIVVGASVLTIPVSRLAARAGRRWSLGLAYALAMLGALVCAAAIAASAWEAVLFGLTLVGGGTVAGLAARFAAAETARRPRDAALAIALVLWASTVGSVVGPNLVSLTGVGASSGAFMLLAALYAIAALVVMLAVPSSPPRPSRARARSSPATVMRVLRGRPAASAGIGLSAIVHVTMVALMAMAPVHLHHDMAPDAVVGLVMSGHLAAMYGLSPLFGLVIARHGTRGSAIASMIIVCCAGGILALSASGDELGFGLGLALLGIGWSMGMVAGSAPVVEALEPDERLATQGTTDLVINVGGGAASVVAGVIVAGQGYAALATAFAVGVGLATVGASWVGLRRRCRPQPHVEAEPPRRE